MPTTLEPLQATGELIATHQHLPADLMLLKMENEQIFSVARMVPRDPMKIVAQLKALIEAYPEAADEAIYSKPVGTVHEVTCGNEKCGIKYEVNKVENDTTCPGCDSTKRANVRKVKKFAEGLSIRAAESIRSIYGYTRLATTMELQPDGKAKLTGVLVDYAAGNLTSDERVVSPFYKSFRGTMERTPEDRFLNVVVKAEKSKLRRDVILDNTPNIIKAVFKDECQKMLSRLVTPEVIEQKIIPAFKEYGISGEQLEKIIGRPYKLGWREEDRLAARKILTALKNEETNVRELLADLQEKPGEANGAATAEALTKPKKAAQPAQKPADTPQPSAENPAASPEKPAFDSAAALAAVQAAWLRREGLGHSLEALKPSQRKTATNSFVDWARGVLGVEPGAPLAWTEEECTKAMQALETEAK